ncbi:MAG: hypothetical protein F8N15_03840 [Methanobacterium sp.]|nr:hypothetical protein [Methanobacterium sp.]
MGRLIFVASGAFAVGIAVAFVFHEPLRNAARSLTKSALRRSDYLKEIYESAQENLEDIRVEIGDDVARRNNIVA